MNRGKIVLIGGGARSGKSAFALRLASKLGERRAFVATARAGDGEMRERIARHRKERQGEFDTVEVPLDLPDALGALGGYQVIVVDCITHWITNLLLADVGPEAILREVDRLIDVLAASAYHSVLVTNEVGMSIHPETALGRAFVEVVGWTNQRLARASDDVYFAVMGTVLPIPKNAGD
jgi:adenosylcobinamide kinase/adenosylcobinamide-phosphate guanylyltransferase